LLASSCVCVCCFRLQIFHARSVEVIDRDKWRSLTWHRETDPNFDQEIANDVRDECVKYGHVRHIFVDKNSMVRPTSSYFSCRNVASADLLCRATCTCGSTRLRRPPMRSGH
jgi:hypothetical protein